MNENNFKKKVKSKCYGKKVRKTRIRENFFRTFECYVGNASWTLDPRMLVATCNVKLTNYLVSVIA